VNTNLAAPKYILSVEAVAPTQVLQWVMCPSARQRPTSSSMQAALRFVHAQYTGYALASAGIGTDTHTITFTVAAQ